MNILLPMRARMKSVATAVKPAVRTMLDFVMPPVCSLCDAEDFDASHSRTSFCPACVRELCPDIVNRCQKCGAEAGAFANTADGCHQCRNYRLRFDSVVCLGMYEESLKQALLASKWSFVATGMTSLARLLAAARAVELRDLKVELIVPIPQHWRQRYWRHFNQSAIVAGELSRALQVPWDQHVLRRSRRTRLQKRTPLDQRFENQRASFEVVDDRLVRGRRVLIVDDVVTTGATCSEAAAALRKAGARACNVATIARVLDSSA